MYVSIHFLKSRYPLFLFCKPELAVAAISLSAVSLGFRFAGEIFSRFHIGIGSQYLPA